MLEKAFDLTYLDTDPEVTQLLQDLRFPFSIHIQEDMEMKERPTPVNLANMTWMALATTSSHVLWV